MVVVDISWVYRECGWKVNGENWVVYCGLSILNKIIFEIFKFCDDNKMLSLIIRKCKVRG